MSNSTGEITRCNKCNQPLARFEGDKVFVMKRQGNKAIELEVETIHGQDRGHTKLRCDGCGSNNFFTRRTEKITLGDKIKRLWKR